MRKALLASAFLLTALAAGAQSTSTLRGVDVYRSAVLTNPEAHRLFDASLREYVSLRNAGTPGARAHAEELRVKMAKTAGALKGVLWADVTMTDFFTSVDHAMYAVFDVVDEADSSRLAFTPAPKAKLKDPEGLIAAWNSYETAGEALSRRGALPVERPSCPGFYCLWGGTPELDAAQTAFVDGAANHSDDLKRVLRADADGGARAAALYVLSYSKSGEAVVAYCREALSDSDARVRGAALQILADVANHQPDLAIPMDAVLPRLDDPVAAVRGKAMGLLVPLADHDPYRGVILTQAPRLVALLKVSQPESRDLAFTLVGILSKKNFDKQDWANWDDWAAKAAAGKR